MAVPNSWRNADGTPMTQPTSTTPASQLVGKVFQAGMTAPFGTGPSFFPGNGTVGLCSKVYLPSKNVYDMYLKDGGRMNYGGDFYTQQNTSANQGGPDAFLCMQNSSTPTTEQINNPYGVFLVNKFCSFAANNGGFVTNLIYNSYIKSIVHSSYGNYSGNGADFKNIKFESTICNNVINILTQNGLPWSTSASAKPSRDISFKDSFIADFYGEIKLPFSNMLPKNNLGIAGTIINQPGGYFNNRLPPYANTSAGLAAANADLWPGTFYRTTPDGIVRVAV
jgi:hypothetical protein